MSEFTRQDLMTDEAFNLPDIYAKKWQKNFDQIIGSVDKLIGKMDSLSQSVMKENGIKNLKKNTDEFNKTQNKFNDSQKELIKIQNQVEQANAKLVASRSEEYKQLIQTRAAQQQHNKGLREEAKATLQNLSPLERLNNERNKAQRNLKNLIAQEELGAKKTDKLTREIKEAQREFNRLDKSFIRVQRSARQFQDNVGNYPRFLGSAKNALKGFIGAFGIVEGIRLFSRVITNAFKRVREFDKELQNIAGVAGVTRKDLAPLEKQIIAVAGSSTKTSNEVAQLASTLITLGNTQEDVIKLLKPVNDLSIALQTTSEEAADFLGQTLNAFGKGADSAQEFADIIANVRSSTSLNFERIKDAFGFVAPTANALGISVGRLGALVGTLQDNGIKAARAGRLLNTSFARLITQGLSLDEALVKINNSQDKVKTATELFGAESFTLGLILAANTEKVDRLANEFDNLSEGSLKTLTDEQLKSIDAQLKILDSTWEQLIISLENGQGILSKIGGFFIGIAQSVLDTFVALEKITSSDYVTFWGKTKSVIATTIPFLKQFVNVHEDLAGRIDEVDKLISKTLEGVNQEFQFGFKGLEKEDIQKQLDNIDFFAERIRDELLKSNFSLDEATFIAQKWADNTVEEFSKVAKGVKDTSDAIEGFGETTSDIIGNQFAQALDSLSRGGLEQFLIDLKQRQAELVREFDKIGGSITSVEEMTDAQKELKKEIDQVGKNIQIVNNAIAVLGDEGSGEVKRLANNFRKEFEALHKDNEESIEKSIEKQQKAIEKAIKDRAKAYEEGLKEEQKKEAENAAIKEQIINESIQLIGEIYRGFADLRIQQISDELNAIQHKRDREIEAINQSAATEEQKEARIAAVNARFDAQERNLKIKQFQAEKQAALVQVAINTALGITKSIASVGLPAAIPLIALATALGAAQAAFIAAQPIPQFAAGEKNAEGGPALVSEEGQELMIHKGKAFLTPKMPSVIDVPKGADIIPHDLTMKILANSLMTNIHRDSRQFEDTRLVGTMEKTSRNIVKAINKKPVYMGNGVTSVRSTRVKQLNFWRNV